MTQVLIFCVIVSWIIWSLWRKHTKWIIGVTGYQNWYRHIYTLSPSWRFARAVKFFWSGKRCKKCRTRNQIDVHHVFYKLGSFSVLYWEWSMPWILRVLCRTCHEREHYGT